MTTPAKSAKESTEPPTDPELTPTGTIPEELDTKTALVPATAIRAVGKWSSGAEREGNQGMTDTRLLGEFRARLAERERLLYRNEAEKSPGPRAGQDWCKI